MNKQFNNKPLVSIIMNCFNGEAYLLESIKSVLAQTYKNWEVIFWDNRSTDNSGKIYKSFNDKRLKYYYASTHTSLYQARNMAIEKCNGEFIAFLDTDDWWIPEKLDQQIQLFKDNEIGLVYSNCYLHYENTKKNKLLSKKKLPIGKVTNALLKFYNMAIITVVIRKKLFDQFQQKFNPKYNIIGDFDFFIKLSTITKVQCVQSPLAYHRYHQYNYSSINYDLEISELEDWSKNQKIFNKASFDSLSKDLKLKIIYMKTLRCILKGDFVNFFKNILSFPWGIKKIELVIAFLLPKKLVKKIKNLQ